MILKNLTYEELAEKIKQEHREVMVYGAGAIGKIVVPYFIQKYHLEPYVRCFVDKDSWKSGHKIQAGTGSFVIKTPDELNYTNPNTIILITNSHFHPVIKMMDEMSELDGREAYVVPVMQICERELDDKSNMQIIKKSDKPLIPKIIHYTWFSGEPIPDHLEKCMDSWKRYAPDFEIKQWNADNYNISKFPYMQQAYEQRKWGYIADVARLDILYQFGGIYMDTDVELVKRPDELLYQTAFCGFEKWGVVNMGGCSGAVSGSPMIKKMLDYRKNEPFIRADGSLNLEPSGAYETQPLVDAGLQISGKTQVIEDMTVYASDFFHPYDYMSGETRMTEHTCSVHHFYGAWLDESVRQQRKNAVILYSRLLERMNRK